MEIERITSVAKVKRSSAPQIVPVEDALALSSEGKRVEEWVEMLKAMPAVRDIPLAPAHPALDALCDTILEEILV